MKNVVKLCVIILAMFAGTVSAQSKSGHINFSQLVQLMPERNSAESTMKEYAGKLQKEMETMQNEFVSKQKDYQSKASTMTDAMRQTKEQELQGIAQRLQAFQQTAQQDMAKKEEEVLTPIITKARTAVSDVAKEQGLTYVFDISQNVVLYQSSNSVDILPLVKKKLGIN